MLAALVLAGVSAPAEAARVLTESAPSLYVLALEIDNNTSIEFETTNLSPGTADSVMHLLRVDGGSVSQVDYSDNWSGLGSRIFYINLGPPGDYILVIRAKSAATSGMSYLRINGDVVDLAPLGGRILSGTALTAGASDTVWAVPPPGGSVNPVQFRMSASGDTIFDMSSPGPAGATTMTWNSSSKVLLGTPYSTLQGTPRSGDARLYSNDATDSDGDGLGDLLEAELGTCVSTACYGGTFVSTDSDRDGLPDGEEVLGQGGIVGDGSDDIGFPRWGADPLQKDVFVEVDYTTSAWEDEDDATDDNPFEGNFFDHDGNSSTPDQSVLEWDAVLRSAFETGPAAQLENPNNEDGVRLHLDLGRGASGVESRYGSYPTASARRVVLDEYITVKDMSQQPWVFYVRGEPWSDPDDYFFVNPALMSTTQQVALAIQAGLLGVSRPLSATVSQKNGDWVVTVEAGVAGQHFEVVAVPFLQADAPDVSVTGEEIYASVAGTRYSKPSQVDAVRRYRFRYAVVAGGGQASGRVFVTDRGYRTFGHELGHTLGLEHWGRGEWLTGIATDSDMKRNEFNCVPWYMSLMNYAYGDAKYPYQFSSIPWSNAISRNPSGVSESTVIPGEDHTFWFGGNPFNLLAGTWWADLDRSEGQSTGSVQAPVRFGGGNCRAFDVGGQPLRFTTPSSPNVGGVSLVRALGRVYAFYTRAASSSAGWGIIRYQVAELGPQGENGCTGPDDPLDYPTNFKDDVPSLGCLNWDRVERVLSTSFHGHGVSASFYGGQMRIATTRSDGTVRYARATIGANGVLNSPTLQSLTGSGAAMGTPAIQQIYGPSSPFLAIVYVSPGATNHLRWLTHQSGTWTDNGMLLSHVPSGYEPTGTPALVSWPDATNTVFTPTSDRRTCVLVPVETSLGPTRPGLTYLCNESGFLGLWMWRDRTASLFAYGATSGPCPSRTIRYTSTQCIPEIVPGTQPAAAVRTQRWSTGAPRSLSTGLGNLVVSYIRPNGAVSPARIQWSNPIEVGTRSLVDASIDKWDTWWVNTWQDVPPTAGIALLDEHGLGSMFGLMSRFEKDNAGVLSEALLFYPFADGTPDIDLRVGSDFAAMEDDICRRLVANGQRDTLCGASNVLE